MYRLFLINRKKMCVKEIYHSHAYMKLYILLIYIYTVYIVAYHKHAMYLIYVGAPMSVIRHGPKSKIAFRWFPVKTMGKFLGCEYIVPTKKN